MIALAWAPESTASIASSRPIRSAPCCSAGRPVRGDLRHDRGRRTGGWTARIVLGGSWWAPSRTGELRRVGAAHDRRRCSIPRLFRSRQFANGSLSIVVQFLMFYGFVFVGQQYLQLVLGYSPLQAAFGLLPLAVVFGVMSPAGRTTTDATRSVPR